MRGVFAARFVPVVCPVLMCANWSLWKEVAHQEGKWSGGCPRPSENSPGQPPHTPWCQHTIRIYPRKGGVLGGLVFHHLNNWRCAGAVRVLCEDPPYIQMLWSPLLSGASGHWSVGYPGEGGRLSLLHDLMEWKWGVGVCLLCVEGGAVGGAACPWLQWYPGMGHSGCEVCFRSGDWLRDSGGLLLATDERLSRVLLVCC